MPIDDEAASVRRRDLNPPKLLWVVIERGDCGRRVRSSFGPGKIVEIHKHVANELGTVLCMADVERLRDCSVEELVSHVLSPLHAVSTASHLLFRKTDAFRCCGPDALKVLNFKLC